MVAANEARILRVTPLHKRETQNSGVAIVKDRTGSYNVEWTVEYEISGGWITVRLLDGSPEDVRQKRYVHGEARIRMHDDATDYSRVAAEAVLSMIR
jgi:hypothetical protein